MTHTTGGTVRHGDTAAGTALGTTTIGDHIIIAPGTEILGITAHGAGQDIGEATGTHGIILVTIITATEAGITTTIIMTATTAHTPGAETLSVIPARAVSGLLAQPSRETGILA